MSVPHAKRLAQQRDALVNENNGLIRERDLLQEQLKAEKTKSLTREYLSRQHSGMDTLSRAASGRWPQGANAYAIIGSMGRTATHWIADAFNLHPQVFFSHGPDFEPRKNVSTEDLEIVSARIIQQMKSFDFSGIDKYFDLLESIGKFNVYGNIHGFSDIPNAAYQLQNDFRRPYYTCAVFRHPVPRVQSFVGKWLSYLREPADLRATVLGLDEYREKNSAYLEELGKAYQVRLFDNEALLFIMALGTTLSYDKKYFLSGVPLFQMERLVGDTDYFLGLFHDVTQGLVEPTVDYVDALRKLSPIDRLSDKGLTAASLFQSWDNWKQQYFLDEVQREEMFDTYDSQGYNLRSLRRSA